MYLFKEIHIRASKERMDHMTWETTASLLSLVIALFTLYNQFHKTELIAYPLIRDTELLLVLENSGNTLVRDFTVKLITKSLIDEYKKIELKDMPFLNGMVASTMAAKTKREIPLGRHFQYYLNEALAKAEEEEEEKKLELPVFQVEITRKYLKLWHKTEIFECNYNVYSREEIVFTSTYHLKNISKTLKGMERNKSFRGF